LLRIGALFGLPFARFGIRGLRSFTTRLTDIGAPDGDGLGDVESADPLRRLDRGVRVTESSELSRCFEERGGDEESAESPRRLVDRKSRLDTGRLLLLARLTSSLEDDLAAERRLLTLWSSPRPVRSALLLFSLSPRTEANPPEGFPPRRRRPPLRRLDSSSSLSLLSWEKTLSPWEKALSLPTLICILSTKALFFLAAPRLRFALEDRDLRPGLLSPSSKLFVRPTLGSPFMSRIDLGFRLLDEVMLTELSCCETARAIPVTGPLADRRGGLCLVSLPDDDDVPKLFLLSARELSSQTDDMELFDRPGAVRPGGAALPPLELSSPVEDEELFDRPGAFRLGGADFSPRELSSPTEDEELFVRPGAFRTLGAALPEEVTDLMSSS